MKKFSGWVPVLLLAGVAAAAYLYLSKKGEDRVPPLMPPLTGGQLASI